MNISWVNIIILSLLSLSLHSCISNSPTGPCEYNEERFRMTIIDIIPDVKDSNHTTVLVDFDGNIRYAEKSYSLEEIRDVKTTSVFVEKNNLKTGNIYRGTLHKKVEGTGNCEDEIIQWENSFKK
ncbi:MAG: hypothetical protein ACPGRC_05465 [Salibacteraceae bacterium]